MVRHIILWKWRVDASPVEVVAALDALVDGVRRSPGAVASTWVLNGYEKHRGFTHAGISDFVDAEAVARWVASDDHERLGARIAELCERVAVLDVEEPFPHAINGG